jgi:glycosyltransferase involved in cell wall biosynthesis
MRVLLVPFPETWRVEGGHRMQQVQTARALHRAGVGVAIGDLELAFSAGFDIVHFFGDPRPLLRVGRPPGRLVVSPVHFPAAMELGPTFREGGFGSTTRTVARHWARSVRHLGRGRRHRADFHDRMAAMAAVDLIVANSRTEASLLVRDAVEPLPSIRVAHSGVDPAFFEGSAEEGRRLIGQDPFVLCVGRIEPRKNQLSLARAMQRIPRRLVLIGAVLQGNEAYLEACRRVLPSLVHVAHVPWDRLPDLYAAADVHVLPSWYETTGLATLEALAAGTPAVAGRGPCVEDYFGNHVRLHAPRSIGQLRRAIRRALEGPTGRERELAASFNWDRTAKELLDAYGG